MHASCVQLKCILCTTEVHPVGEDIWLFLQLWLWIMCIHCLQRIQRNLQSLYKFNLQAAWTSDKLYLYSPPNDIRQTNNKIATGQLSSFMKHGALVSYFTSFGCGGTLGFVWICIFALLTHYHNYCKSTDIPSILQPTFTEPHRSSAFDSRRWRAS